MENITWNYKGYEHPDKKYYGDQTDWNQTLVGTFHTITNRENMLFATSSSFKDLFLTLKGFTQTSKNVGMLDNMYSIYFTESSVYNDNTVQGENGLVIKIINY